VSGPTGVLLMTYGSAVTSADVPRYLRSVYRGAEPPPEVVKEFEYRYDLVGGSPLIEITLAQGQALQAALDRTAGPGTHLVEVGMLHSAPRIPDAVVRLADAGVTRLVGIVLSPQYSPLIMGGYPRALASAAERLGPGAEATVAGPWHLVPAFVDSLAGRVTAALAQLGDVPVLFTAHSLPKAVVDRDRGYLDQLHETIAAVVERTGLPEGRWRFAYQSAGHTPEEWLTPDLKDLLPDLHAAGHHAVLVVPVQFLADHLEILFDIDVAARQEAEEAGLAFHRIELPNTDPAFIEALRQVVLRESSSHPAG
jgi:protoporphyrin/coproporphyrin ferrochelatase